MNTEWMGKFSSSTAKLKFKAKANLKRISEKDVPTVRSLIAFKFFLMDKRIKHPYET